MFLLPLQKATMAKVSDFVAGIAKGGKSYAEISIAILDNIVTMDETMVSYHA
jgi:hypothetical protein